MSGERGGLSGEASCGLSVMGVAVCVVVAVAGNNQAVGCYHLFHLFVFVQVDQIFVMKGDPIKYSQYTHILCTHIY